MRVVTLLSDFGSRSPYPAQMKAAVLRRCDAVLVDVTHDVRPQDVREGAYILRAAVRAFPPGTAHLAVVDPGVGTSRRGLAVEAAGHHLVGPDNGLLMPAAARLGLVRVRAIENRALVEPSPSSTFHGRDVFAPVAAYLACGGDPAEVGPEATDPVALDFGEGRRDGDRLLGQVIYIDPFGNLVTNLPGGWLEGLAGRAVDMLVGDAAVSARVAVTYAGVEPGALAVLAGSGGEVEIAARDAGAAALTGGRPGDRVVIVPLSNVDRTP